MSLSAAEAVSYLARFQANGLVAADERASYTYLLRVLAFLLILVAIVDKNLRESGSELP